MSGKRRDPYILTFVFVLVFAGSGLAQPTTYNFTGNLSVSGQETAIPRLGTALSRLAQDYSLDPMTAAAAARQKGLEIQSGLVKVTMVGENEFTAQVLMAGVTSLGGQGTASFGKQLDAWIPVSQLEAMSELSGLEAAFTPRRPIHPDPKAIPASSGSTAAADQTYISQGVTASGADLWHAAGYKGQGVKIAVLDNFQKLEEAQAAGELPQVTIYKEIDQSDCHGTACAEIIHDMAPEAQLTLASPLTDTELAQYILDLAREGHHVISCSMGFPKSTPGDGTGVVPEAINQAAQEYGTVYCQSAGNYVGSNWVGYWADFDQDGILDFGQDSDGPMEVNVLGYGEYPAEVEFLLAMRWNDWPTTDQDYDLIGVFWNGEEWVQAPGSENEEDSPYPREYLSLVTHEPGYYGFVIQKASADGTHLLDVISWDYSFRFYNGHYCLTDESCAAEALSVAAVDVEPPYTLEGYSSWGPTLGLGGTLEWGMAKPDIAAFANVDTFSYLDELFFLFGGTSAATPHVAGAAALIRSAFPGYGAQETKQYLINNTVNQNTDNSQTYYLKEGAGRLYMGPVPGD